MIGSLLLAALLAERPYLGPTEVPAGTSPREASEPIAVQEPRGKLGAIVWAPDSRSFWVVGGPALYRVHADTGALLAKLAVPDRDEVDALVISANGTHLAATTTSDVVTVWNSKTGKITLRASHEDWMLDELVAFSPDGKQVFAAFYGEDRDGEELIRIEAWEVASGRSLGKKRVRELPSSSHDSFVFTPIRLAGHHVYFDDLSLIARTQPIRACDDELPEVAAGDVAWYSDGSVRHIDDCKVVHADTSALDSARSAREQLTPRGDRAAFLKVDGNSVQLAVVDLAADAELARVEYGDVSRVPGFALAPDGSQVAAVMIQRGPDGGRKQFLLLWRPLAAGGATARVLALLVPPT